MKMKGPGRMLLCMLTLLMIMSVGTAERKIPDVLRVTQEIVIDRLANHRIITYSVLNTVRQDVNEAINARVAELTEETKPLVPRGKDNNNQLGRGDICTQITRTGGRWMSFHIVAQVSRCNDQLRVKSEEYTYDMESGRLIPLGEIICEEGWEPLLRETRRQLEDLFPEDQPDEAALDAVCCRERLNDAGFVMTPGHLALYFPAEDIYPSHTEALLRVEIYVPELQGMLTEEARKETDCTGYELVAMTYDDGPGKGRTRVVLNASVCYPGLVTFFVIGHRMSKNAELLHREYDAGHSVQSHTWNHSIEGVNPAKVAREKVRYDQTMGRIIGTVPVMMRPPGGRWSMYTKAGTSEPMILWQVNSLDVSLGDSPEDLQDSYEYAMAAGDGDIVLFHDMKAAFSGELAEMCMESFEERNMLLVTVNDLCALRGIALEPGLILKSCPPDGKE